MTSTDLPAALAPTLTAALAAAVIVAPAPLAAQATGGLDPATLAEPLEAAWPTTRATTRAGATASCGS